MSLLINKKAPDFISEAILGNGEIVEQFSFSKEIKDKYSVLFFYPLDFTFVCPSELIALDRRMDKFREKNIEVIAVSVDSHFSHYVWRSIKIENGGIGPVNYPIVADVNHNICKAYGVQHEEQGVAYRATFIIDKKGIVRAQLVNDLPLGRNIDELLRLVEALAFHDENGEVCPAGWMAGDKGIVTTLTGVADYLSKHASKL